MSLSSGIYTIAGITGNVGGAIAEKLILGGYKVRGVVRSASSESSKKLEEKGVELFEAQFGDVNGLTKAFSGADGVFVLAPPDLGSDDPLGDTLKYGEAFKEAVIAAKVPRVAFLSSFGAHLSSGSGVVYKCHILENLFRDLPEKSGDTKTTVIYVRAGYFAENTLGLIPFAQQYGILSSLVEGNVPLPFVTTHDIGYHTADLLSDKVNIKQGEIKIVDVTGPSWITYSDAASALSKVLGKPIQLSPIPRNERQTKLESFGLGTKSAKLIAELTFGIEDQIVTQEPGHQQLKGSQTILDFFTQVTSNKA